MIQALLVLVLFTSSYLIASDQSKNYNEIYKQNVILRSTDLASLKNTEIVLIPGIVSESFIWSDHRGSLDFSILFKDYFGAQLSHYKKLGVSVTRLKGSSKSVQETVAQIEEKIKELSSKNKKAIFVTHSLGGLALLDWMMEQDKGTLETIRSIVFLQAPFYGSPVATVYFQNSYYARTILGPITPFINTSEETIKYLSVEKRQKTMADYESRLDEVFEGISVLTMSGVSLNAPSLFLPSLNIIGHGCVTFLFGNCRTRKIFEGPLDDSDGMVPFNNSKLENYDFVRIENVDHGETVLQMPFNNIDRVHMTDALIRMTLKD
jgi:predicted alpha/beta hydrolase family esterase